MTDTYPASPIPARARWRLMGNSQIFRSPLSGAEQTIELQGSVWVVSLDYDIHNLEVYSELEAFLNSLNGMATSFYLWNHARENPRGVATGTPLVDGASQTGKTLSTKGWTPGVTGILKAGDMIAVNGELKQVKTDTNSDGSGLADITISPALRASPLDNAPITVTKALGTFRLASNEAPEVVYSGPNATIGSINVVETF